MTENITYKNNAEKNIWEVALAGEIDIFNSEDIKTKLSDLISEKEQNLVIDCDDLAYIDSTGLSALVAVLKKVKGYSGEIALKNLRPNVFKVIRITNLDKLFVIEGDKDE